MSRFNLKRSINQSTTCHTIRILIWSFLTYFLKVPLLSNAYVMCYMYVVLPLNTFCAFAFPFLILKYFFFSWEGKTLFLHFPIFRHYCLRAYWKRYASSFKFSYLDRRKTSSLPCVRFFLQPSLFLSCFCKRKVDLNTKYSEKPYECSLVILHTKYWPKWSDEV